LNFTTDPDPEIKWAQQRETPPDMIDSWTHKWVEMTREESDKLQDDINRLEDYYPKLKA
jgi:hypothetical protein